VTPTFNRNAEIAGLQGQLEAAGYVAEAGLAATLLLTLDLERPLLVEGDAGVGKTEIAKAFATVRNTRLIRLQCYEGLDVHAAMCTFINKSYSATIRAIKKNYWFIC